MIRLDREDNLDWIFQNIDKLELAKGWKGNYVSHLLPNRFERFIKILHPFFYVNSSMFDENMSRTNFKDSDLKQIKWIELAKRYNIPFTKTINPSSFRDCFTNQLAEKYLLFPEEGSLQKNEMLELIHILSDFCLEMNCYFYYGQLVFSDFDNEHLYKGEVTELIDLYKSLPWEVSPSYMWSDKKDWCLNTDYDLTFTVIGCNDALAEMLLASEVLESIEVDINTRIDFKADEKSPK